MTLQQKKQRFGRSGYAWPGRRQIRILGRREDRFNPSSCGGGGGGEGGPVVTLVDLIVLIRIPAEVESATSTAWVALLKYVCHRITEIEGILLLFCI